MVIGSFTCFLFTRLHVGLVEKVFLSCLVDCEAGKFIVKGFKGCKGKGGEAWDADYSYSGKCNNAWGAELVQLHKQ